MKWISPKIKLQLILQLKQESGFSLIELLVATLVVTFFFILALEAMVLATLGQIRAREDAQATLEIQENLESVRAFAASYEPNPANFLDLCANVGGVSLADDMLTQIQANSALDVPSSVTLTASNKSYSFQRNFTTSNTEPNLVSVRYEIDDGSNSRVLAELFTEVIPDVAVDCP